MKLAKEGLMDREIYYQMKLVPQEPEDVEETGTLTITTITSEQDF